MREELSLGRRFPEPKHPYRSEYARDRDRIIHARAFRRLEAKTQVFTSRYSDHFRNRLTHTLEVTQIARTVAAALRLNEELAEALALVHDMGHPPFGHAGERKLNELMSGHGGFDHNIQALRIVEQFEQKYLDFPGLNLTFEVREGIIKHSRDYSAAEHPQLAEYLLGERPPLESQLIDWVDEIAYNTADLDDAREAGLLDFETFRSGSRLFDDAFRRVETSHPRGKDKLKFNEALKIVLNALVTDLILTTSDRVNRAGIQTVDDVRKFPERLAAFSPKVAAENANLKKFLFANIYERPEITEDRDHSVGCLEQLFQFYVQTPKSMPRSYEELSEGSPRIAVVCDYVAGMTDQFLLRQHREHFSDSNESAAHAD